MALSLLRVRQAKKILSISNYVLAIYGGPEKGTKVKIHIGDSPTLICFLDPLKRLQLMLSKDNQVAVEQLLIRSLNGAESGWGY